MNNLLIDFYELTMSQCYFNENKHEQMACFDLFFRKCPDGASFVIASGIEKCARHLLGFHFDESDISYLKSLNRFSDDFLEYLSKLKFSGDLYAVPDGTVVFPNEPILTVVAPLVEAQLVETALLLLFNHASLITTKTNRIVRAAKGRAVMEFGTRRAQGYDAADSGALWAYVGGACGTACTATGKNYGVPVSGTMAHSFVQSFDSEYEAFCAYARSAPDDTTLLVDTYDTLGSGVPNAIRVAKEVLEPMGKNLKAIRIDSGDLIYLSKKARQMLNAAGLESVKICVSNSLDEYTIAELLEGGAEIDLFGVGERLITSASCPVLGGVYKLVALDDGEGLTPKIKISDTDEKTTTPCFKDIIRLYDADEKIIADLLVEFDEEAPEKNYTLVTPSGKQTTITNFRAEKIRQKVIEKGRLLTEFSSPEILRKRVSKQLAFFKEENLKVDSPEPVFVCLSEKLRSIKKKLLEKGKIQK